MTNIIIKNQTLTVNEIAKLSQNTEKNGAIINDYTFENCVFSDPMVIFLQDCELRENTIKIGSTLVLDRDVTFYLSGVISFNNCKIINSDFKNVTFIYFERNTEGQPWENTNFLKCSNI